MTTLKNQTGPLKKRAFTVQEVADQCGVAIDAIYRAIYTKKLMPMAGFGRYHVSDIELERFLGVTRTEGFVSEHYEKRVRSYYKGRGKAERAAVRNSHTIDNGSSSLHD